MKNRTLFFQNDCQRTGRSCHLSAQHLRCTIIKNWGPIRPSWGNAPWPLGGRCPCDKLHTVMVWWENNNCTRIDDILQNAWEIFTKFWSAAYLVQFRTVVTLRSKGQSQVHNETKYSQKSLVQKLTSPAKACHHRSKLTAREHVWTSYSSSLTYYIYLLTSLLIIANIRHVASSCT